MNADGTNLWDCGNCGTRAIAAGLAFCPNCRKEKEVPAVNRAGHSTIYGEPNEAQRAAAVGISPPKQVSSEDEAGSQTEKTPDGQAPKEQDSSAQGDSGQVTGSSLDSVTGSQMIDSPGSISETGSDPISEATEKASQAKEAFSSGDKASSISLLDEAIALDPSRSDKWTKLKDQVAGSGEQW